MRYKHFLFPLVLSLALLTSLTAPVLAIAVKYKTTGTYTDSAGTQHPWSVSDAHALIWDGQPYIPVGGVFMSRYLSEGATDANFQADVRALQTAKDKGITDIILKSTGPATLGDPAAWQKMIDHLEANGFSYGLELDDGPKEPLKGFLISPNRYRLEGPSMQTTVTCDWPSVDSAVFVVVNKADNSVKTTGGAVVADGKVTINLTDPLSSSQILIVYPRKVFKAIADGGIGDVWTGFGEYRDRAIDFFKKIKLGPGMRFFLEPLSSKMDFAGEMNGFLPDSQGFRLGLEAYLTKRHKHEGSVNAAWALNDNLSSIEDAARLMPLWYSGRGVGYAYDRASAHLFSVDASSTQMWRDLLEYRDSSALEYMNTIADTLRKQVADVPVVYRCSNHHRVYANPYGMSGFDGLGAVAYGLGDTPVVKAAGAVYSLAEESGKSTWFIAAATQTSSENKNVAGYPSENAMTSALDSLREVGCKGFFVDSLQSLPEQTRGNFSLLNDPKELDWLKAFKDKLKGAAAADYKPTVISYPVTPAIGAGVKRLARNTWWLPSLRRGATTYIGDGLSAYSLAGEDKTYLWCSSGTRTITLKTGPMGYPSVEYPERGAIAKKKNNLFTVSLTDSPTVLKGMDLQLAFPQETASGEIAKLSAAIIQADKAGIAVNKARDSLQSAKNVMQKGNPLTAYGMAQQAMAELMVILGADVWVEGELSPAHNFDGPTAIPGASGSLALVLDTADDPPLIPYTASFVFDAPANSSYEIWVAATPPTEGSAMSFSVEDAAWTPIAASEKVEPYAPSLAWYKIGTANLFPGRHTIKIRAESKRVSDSRYYFAVDALVFSPRGFKPNGVIKP